MAIQIKLKNSVVQDSTPSTSDLPAVGEIALNANINSIGGFMRASDNSIVKIFGPGSLSTPTATTTVPGISELATNTETTAGSATNRVVTPAGLNAVTVAERTTSNTNYVAKAGSTLTGVLTMPNGSNSAPAINFGDSDSGIFGGTNTVSLAAGGTTRLTADTGVSVTGTLAVTGAITSTSDLTIADKIIHAGDTNTAVRFPAADTVSVETGGSERARIDSSGRLLVGTSAARSPANVAASLQVEGTDAATSSISITRNSANTNSANLIFNKSRGAAVGSDTVVQNNDTLGIIGFAGNDGTDSNNAAAQIAALVDGTPGSNDMPGRLEFKTTADGAASPTTRLTIDSAGLVKIPDNGKFVAGTGSDLEIYHDGTHSHITNATNDLNISCATSDADLIVKAKKVSLKDLNNNFLLRGETDAEVKLYHSGSIKLQTSSSGVSVTGAITATGNITTGNNSSIFAENNLRFKSSGGAFIDHNTVGQDINFRVSGSSSNDTNALTVKSSGNVGIGTTSPLTDAQLTISADENPGLAFQRSGSGRFETAIQISSGHFHFKAGADSSTIAGLNDVMKIESTGNVGIGTTSPSATVHIVNDDPQLRLQRSGSHSTTAGPLIQFQGRGPNTVNYNFAKIQAVSSGSNNAGELQFFTNVGGNQDKRMTIDSSGRILTGGASTSQGSTNADDLQIGANNQGNQTGITLGSASASSIRFADAANDSAGSILYNHGTDDLTITAADNIILTGDAVGIGTTSPDSILDITSDTPLITFNSTVTSLGSDNLIGGMKVFKSDASGSGTGICGSLIWRSDDSVGARTYIQFTNRQNSNNQTNTDSECMRIGGGGATGNVNIGTSTVLNLGANNVTGINLLSTGRLIACSSGSFSQFGRQGSNGTVIQFACQGTNDVGSISVTTTSTAYNQQPSDRSLKKNFEEWTENTLQLFKNINPQKFNFIKEDDGTKKTKGYIAQDLVDSFPEAYPKNDDDKYMFNPSGMVVYLMKAIQELEAKVAALEAA